VTISCIVATFGVSSWEHLAKQRAIPSTEDQGLLEVISIHLPEGTLAQARNLGALHAHGDWLLFLDADDELRPGFILAMNEALEQLEPGQRALLTPAVAYLHGRTVPRPKIWPRMDIRDGNWMIIGTLVQRDLFHEVGGFREYGWSEDWALWGACMKAGAIAVEVPDAVYVAHITAKSRNRNKPRQMILYWHARIGHDLWPEIYACPSEEEDAAQLLATGSVLRLDGR
jgi:glycosyltransferase involved in cell wall biosynthesis